MTQKAQNMTGTSHGNREGKKGTETTERAVTNVLMLYEKEGA